MEKSFPAFPEDLPVRSAWVAAFLFYFPQGQTPIPEIRAGPPEPFLPFSSLPAPAYTPFASYPWPDGKQ